jgi:rhomboid protease GluP
VPHFRPQGIRTPGSVLGGNRSLITRSLMEQRAHVADEWPNHLRTDALMSPRLSHSKSALELAAAQSFPGFHSREGHDPVQSRDRWSTPTLGIISPVTRRISSGMDLVEQGLSSDRDPARGMVMSATNGNHSSENSWASFVLASCASLGPFSQVHLAPRFPPGRLNLALRSELPLLENELVVGLIENDSSGFQSAVVLTTSRLYLSTSETEAEQARRGTGRQSRLIRNYGMDYSAVRPGLEVEPAVDGGFQIALSPGNALPLHGISRELALALARFLRSVGDAARSGVVPPRTAFDPELNHRIDTVLPTVVDVTGRIRALNRDLHSFRRDLQTATSRSLVTTLLTMACVLLFVIMTVSGVDPITPKAEQLLWWGANHGARVVLRHEWWRLPASVFIHGGLIHLAVNMWFLFSVGPLVERLFGNLVFALIYLAAGIGGAIASTATLPVRVSVGASGANFGILGALLAFLIIHRRSVPATVLRPLRSSALSFVIFNTLFGAVVPNIDQSAHLGGLLTGFLAGLVLTRPWPVVRSPWVTSRRVLIGLATVMTLAGVGIGVIRWRERTIPPLSRLRDFAMQIEPSIEEFTAVSQGLPSLSDLREEAGTVEGRRLLSKQLVGLSARTSASLHRLEQVVTPDLNLRELRRSLIDGHRAQSAILAAALDYLNSRDAPSLNSQDRLLQNAFETGLVSIQGAQREFEAKYRAYLDSQELMPQRARSE